MYQNTEKMYNSLLNSIDFFSQNLNVNQIVEYGFQIFNSFEMPLASAIYAIDDTGKNYSVRFHQGYDIGLPCVEKTDRHSMFAVRNGFLLTSYDIQCRYYDEEFLKLTKASKIMPLIIDDQLFGFIISIDSKDCMYDVEFLNRFNYLMNLSLEKASRCIERNKLKKEIDKRIFNLDSISQTMKLLLSELNVNGIIQLSIDVIREMTSSSITSIALFDEIEKCIKVTSYEDLVCCNKVFEKFHLREDYTLDKKIYKMPEDFPLLELLFEDADNFKNLSAEYVILIVKENIIGFVTLGSPLAFDFYEKDLINRIQDIASIMHIALTNARQFEIIKSQKSQLDRQVNTLETMNRFIKTISSADSIDELADMVLTTLNAYFDIEKAIFVIFDGEKGKILCNMNMEIENFNEEFFNVVRKNTGEQTLVSYTMDCFKEEFSEKFGSYFKNMNAFILSPIFLSGLCLDPIGYIIVTNVRNRLTETQVHLIKILSNSIGPLLNQLIIVDNYSNNYVPNPMYQINLFLDNYKRDFHLYSLNFKVYIKKLDLIPFVENDIEAYSQFDTIIYQEYIIIFSQTDIDSLLYDTKTDYNPTLEEIKSHLDYLKKGG